MKCGQYPVYTLSSVCCVHVVLCYNAINAFSSKRDSVGITYYTRGAMGGATGGGRDNVPLTFGTSGVQGGDPMKMIFASTADSFYSVLHKWRTFQPSVIRQNAEMHIRPAHFPKESLCTSLWYM